MSQKLSKTHSQREKIYKGSQSESIRSFHQFYLGLEKKKTKKSEFHMD